MRREVTGLAEQILWLFFQGITSGCVYAFVALSYVVVYSMTGLFNLLAGEFLMFGAILASVFYGLGLPLLLSIVLALIVSCIIGAITWLLFLHHGYSTGAPHLTLLLIIAALAIAFMGIAYVIWGASPRTLPNFTEFKPVIANVTISAQAPWIWGILLLTIGYLVFLFDRTLLGKAFRACSEQPMAATLMGINPNFMACLSFMLSALLGAIAGVTLIPLTTANYAMGLGLSIKGCLAAMVGGIERFEGAIIGGLLLGLLETFAGGFVSSGFMEAIALGILIVVLLFIPEGILGRKEEKLCRG